MLTKHTDIEIPTDNPFANDQLERKKIAENLTRLVQSTNQPFVISIEASWGSGKTTFIKIWKTYLESLGHSCLYFNAWENDFVEDPLIAFIGEIGKVLNAKKIKGKARTQLKKLQNIGGKIVHRALPLIIQIATHGLLDQDTVKGASSVFLANSDEIAKFASELAEEKIKQYENDKNGISEFKKELAKFAKTISESVEEKSPLIFFIDELDRCKPEFGIALLERIKHVFSVEGVVFILGIDHHQIVQLVRTRYGNEMNSDGYLRRFIDYRFILPRSDKERFCYDLFNKFNLGEVFKNRQGSGEERILLDTFHKLSEFFELSLRSQEQCFTEINLVYRTTFHNHRILPAILVFLIILKAHRQELYVLLHEEIVDIDSVLMIFQSSKKGIDFLRTDGGIEIESALINDCQTRQQKAAKISKLEEVASDGNNPEHNYSRSVLDCMQYTKGSIKSLLPRIEITKDFSL